MDKQAGFDFDHHGPKYVEARYAKPSRKGLMDLVSGGPPAALVQSLPPGHRLVTHTHTHTHAHTNYKRRLGMVGLGGHFDFFVQSCP